MAPTTAEAAASDFVIPGSISTRAVEAYVEAALRADPVRSDWTRGHEWNQLDPAEVRVPTLILQGEHDPLSPQELALPLFTGLGTTDKARALALAQRELIGRSESERGAPHRDPHYWAAFVMVGDAR